MTNITLWIIVGAILIFALGWQLGRAVGYWDGYRAAWRRNTDRQSLLGDIE